SGRSRWQPCTDWLTDGKSTPVGAVSAPLPEIPPHFARHNSRNNRLLLAALAQIRPAVDSALARYGAARIGIIMGTSNSGIDEGGLAIARHRADGVFPEGYFYQQQELGDPAAFLGAYLGTEGPCYTISTACSSSSRAIISARRLISAGVVDAVIAGGADALCRMTLNGFHSLEALSLTGCRPFAANRDGITIGEAAALVLLSREPAPVALLGTGESSDAYHASAPHPDGIGAEAAMRQALDDARLAPGDIGYINFHGTGTPLNDSMESIATHRIFGTGVPCSSTKHLTGHTLGTCGVTEAALCHLLLTDPGVPLPPQDFSQGERDATLAPVALVDTPGQALGKPRILSNSFAFGGNNACLLIGAA
ncbi:MAG: beta-ketoacyl-[acyl-carrier-protein] synthase family protein, partial [Puniceicoccales bacterium]|nr:beta-ketoacyl-[acyl-carrier-protein] synthase family protein [Puniceicoccales bacterium]